eukprot:767148-Hanusia_phi.AAC.2
MKLYDISVVAENTLCLDQGIAQSGVECCTGHTCSPLSVATRNSTLMGSLPTPFIKSATSDAIEVGWNVIQGSTGNIKEIQVEYQVRRSEEEEEEKERGGEGKRKRRTRVGDRSLEHWKIEQGGGNAQRLKKVKKRERDGGVEGERGGEEEGKRA